jgi:hypothetical protein
MSSAYEWRCATDDAAFEPRDGAGLLSFKGRLWLLGGWNPWGDEAIFPHPADTNSEVWSSADGRDWRLETHAPWPSRHCAGWLVHDDGDGEKLFVVGGDANPPVGYDTDVWSSVDGRSWTCLTARTPWSPRAGAMTVSFDGFIWVMGGQTKGDPDSVVGFVSARDEGEIVDGKPQQAESIIATVNKGAEAGSEEAYNDVWRSRDGRSWECVTETAGWSPRAWVGGSAVLHGRMWVIGGGFIGGFHAESGTVGYIQDTLIYEQSKPSRPSYNDVWSSSDGKEWRCHTEHAAFRRRHYHEIMAWDNKLWVLEGYNGEPGLYPEESAGTVLPAVGAEGNRNDVWWSEDGAEWFELEGTPWPPRHAASVTVHAGELFIGVGNTDWTGNPKLHGAEGYRADVWALRPARGSAAAL